MATILHVTECFAGGVSRAIYSAVALAPIHEHVLLWAGDELPRESAFASVSRLPAGGLARVGKVRDTVRTLRPDLLHAHSSWAGVYSRVLPVKTRVIYQPHCYKFEDLEAPRYLRSLYRLAERMLAGRADTVVVLSPREDALALALDPGGRRHFLPNVPAHRPRSLESGHTTASVVMIGRISRQKDPEYFIRVARLVRQSHPSARFVWIGDGDARLRARLVEAEVAVTGWLDSPALVDQLSKGSIYLHSAAYEGFPISVLDAAAFGLPVVARRIPALDGSPILQASTEAEAADLVGLLLDDDRVIRDRARELNSELLKMMSPERQAQALTALYSGSKVEVP